MMQLEDLNGNKVWINYRSVDALVQLENGTMITLTSGVSFNVKKSCADLIELIKAF